MDADYGKLQRPCLAFPAAAIHASHPQGPHSFAASTGGLIMGLGVNHSQPAPGHSRVGHVVVGGLTEICKSAPLAELRTGEISFGRPRQRWDGRDWWRGCKTAHKHISGRVKMFRSAIQTARERV